jgi:hypothetical protein
MPSRNLKQEYSTNSELSNEPREEKSPAPEADDSLADLNLDDLDGGVNDAAIIEALSSDDRPSERRKAAEAARNARIARALAEHYAAVAKRDSGSIKVTEPEESDGRIKSPELRDDRSIKVTEPSSKARSIKVTSRKRRSPARDRQVLKKIRELEPEPPPGVSSSFSSDLSAPILIPSTDTKRPSLPVWELTGDDVKLALATIALQVSWGYCTSWTFNLIEEALKKALKHPKGFVRSLTLAFNRALKRRFGYVPVYWLCVDTNKFGRLHLHGAIALGPDDHPLLQEVMKEAWGAQKGRGKELQIDLNHQRCDDGWADYALRNRAKVRPIIGEHTFYIADELRRAARHAYSKQLREMAR